MKNEEEEGSDSENGNNVLDDAHNHRTRSDRSRARSTSKRKSRRSTTSPEAISRRSNRVNTRTRGRFNSSNFETETVAVTSSSRKPKTRNQGKQTVIYRDLDEESENQSYDSEEVSDDAEEDVATTVSSRGRVRWLHIVQ